MRGEAANAVIIEAIILFFFVITTIGIATTLQTNESPVHTAAAQHHLHANLQDALRALATLTATDHYAHILDKTIAKAYQDNTTDLDATLQRALPPGAGYRLILDNGHVKHILSGPPEDPRREQVAAQVLWHPTWDYAALIPDYDVVPPTMAMPVQSYAVAQGALVQEGGVPIRVELTTQDANTGSTATYHTAFTTSIRNQSSAYLTLQANDGTDGYNWTDPSVLPNTTLALYNNTQNGVPIPGSFLVPAGSLTLNLNATATGTGASYTLTVTQPGGNSANYTVTDTTPLHAIITTPLNDTWNVTASSGPIPPSSSNVNATAIQPHYNADWNITVHETTGMDLPAGTNLTVTFPAPFTEQALQNRTQTGWRNITTQTAPDGGVIVTAELDTPLSGAARVFTAHADRGATASSALYLVRAYLGNGAASSMSTFVITNALGVNTPVSSSVQHTFYASAAKPIAPGAATQWGFTFVYPAAASSQVLTETLQRMDVTAPEGSEVFASFDGRSNQAKIGWTWISPSHVFWVPPQGREAKVAPNADYQVLFPFTAIPGGSTSTEPWSRLPVAFDNGFTDQAYDQVQPFVFTDAYPPAIPGTPLQGHPADVAHNATVNLTTAYYTRSSLAYGTATFNTSVLASLSTHSDALRLGLLQSSVTLSTSKVRLGETVNVTANFTGLLSNLGASVTAWAINASVYDPIQPFRAFQDWQPTQSAVVNSGGGAVQFDFTPNMDAFYGPYCIVAQAHLRLSDVNGATVNVSARQVAVLNVVPDGGQAESALYWVILEAWMPDWG